MSDMVRKQIYITRSQNLLLKRLAKSLGISEAEVFRNALEKEEERIRRSEGEESAVLTKLDRLYRGRTRLGITGEPYYFNREELYNERENRWLRDRAEDEGEK
jgi:hypothetical protein